MLLALVASLFVVSVGVTPATATLGTDDYPYASDSPAQVDPWSFYKRECTSFVAWRLNNDAGVAFENTMTGPDGDSGTWSHAYNWDNTASSIGYAVNSSPAKGAVAQWEANYHGAGANGHVAYVKKVNYSGSTVTSIEVEEYNNEPSPDDHDYGTRNNITPAGGEWPSNFIHVRDVHDVVFNHNSGSPNQPYIKIRRANDGSYETLASIGTDYAYQPDVSPDGSKIVYQGKDGNGDPGLYKVNSDGTGSRTQLTTENDTGPKWSPDGTKVVFRRQDLSTSQFQVWVMDADGSNETRLTPNTGSPLPQDDVPDWSPDGSKIVFASANDAHTWVMDADGTDRNEVYSDSAGGWDPNWVTGDKIYVRRGTSFGYLTSSNSWASTAGTSYTAAPNAPNAPNLHASKDGLTVYYDDYGSCQALYAIPAAGGSTTKAQITNTGGSCSGSDTWAVPFPTP